MGKLTERMKKEKKGRKRIAKILSAMKFHDPHLQATVKLMRNKLQEIKQRESSVKPQKVIFKLNGSKHVVLNHRRSPQTLLSPNHETHEVMSLEKPPNLTAEMNMSNDHDVMDFIKSVGGSEVELVIEKRLTQSDVTTNQGRLLIPILQVKNRGFLTSDEELILMGNKQGISVSVFDPERRKWTLNLTKWKMSKEYNYVFKTNWNDVVTANGWNHVVKANGEMVIIRVLSFRVDQRLCFALDRVA